MRLKWVGAVGQDVDCMQPIAPSLPQSEEFDMSALATLVTCTMLATDPRAWECKHEGEFSPLTCTRLLPFAAVYEGPRDFSVCVMLPEQKDEMRQ